MPVLSAFTPLGLLRFSRGPSRGERFYRQIVANLGGTSGKAYDLTRGTHLEAIAYAMAMGLARWRTTLERAGNEGDPLKTTQKLARQEADYGVVPGPKDGPWTRRRALAAAHRAAAGAPRWTVEAELELLLGSAFVAYIVPTDAETNVFPADPSAAGAATQFARLDVPPKFARLAATSWPGRPLTIEAYPGILYERVAVGESVVIEPENLGLAERVQVTAVSADGLTLTCAPIRAHQQGAMVTTAPFPVWSSSRRSVLVVVTAAAAVDPETRRKVDALMRKMLRGTATWAIVADHAGFVGPFRVDSSPLGTDPLAARAEA